MKIQKCGYNTNRAAEVSESFRDAVSLDGSTNLLRSRGHVERDLGLQPVTYGLCTKLKQILNKLYNKQTKYISRAFYLTVNEPLVEYLLQLVVDNLIIGIAKGIHKP